MYAEILEDTDWLLKNSADFWKKHGLDKQYGGFKGTVAREGESVAPFSKGLIAETRYLWSLATLKEHGVVGAEVDPLMDSLYTFIVGNFLNTSNNLFCEPTSSRKLLLLKFALFWPDSVRQPLPASSHCLHWRCFGQILRAHLFPQTPITYIGVVLHALSVYTCAGAWEWRSKCALLGSHKEICKLYEFLHPHSASPPTPSQQRVPVSPLLTLETRFPSFCSSPPLCLAPNLSPLVSPANRSRCMCNNYANTYVVSGGCLCLIMLVASMVTASHAPSAHVAATRPATTSHKLCQDLNSARRAGVCVHRYASRARRIAPLKWRD